MHIKHFKKARYIGKDESIFVYDQLYRGDFYVFDRAVLIRHATKIYQSGKANWEGFECEQPV